MHDSCPRRLTRTWHQFPRLLPVSTVLAFLTVSCGTSPTAPHDINGVAFRALGSGTVMFQRIGNVSKGGSFTAVYVIDGDADRIFKARDDLIMGPSLSPSGDAVAFLKQTPGACWDAYVSDLGGGNPRRLTSFVGVYVCNIVEPPSWTPDGTSVLFQVHGQEPSTRGIFQRVLATDVLAALCVTDADGSRSCLEPCSLHLHVALVSVSTIGGLARICNADLEVSEHSNAPLTSRYQTALPRRLWAVAWSPTGDRVAFLEVLSNEFSAADPEPAILSTSLKVLHLASGHIQTVAVVPGSGHTMWLSANHISLCWLPTSNKLVFNAPSTGILGTAPMRAHLYVAGADGSGVEQLTTAPDAFDHSVSCSR